MSPQIAQKQVNEAAEKLADGIKKSYQAIADRSARELDAQLTQESVNAFRYPPSTRVRPSGRSSSRKRDVRSRRRTSGR